MESKMRDVREELIDRLHLEFTGPNEEEEELEELPSLRYMNGILWPPQSTITISEDDTNEITGKRESTEELSNEKDIPLSKSLNPSSIGLSFTVDIECKALLVNVSYGKYEKLGHNHWKRVPVYETVFIEMRQTPKRIPQKINGDKGVFIEYLIRKFQNKYTISLFLVNKKSYEKESKIEQDTAMIFQPQLEVTTNDVNITHPFLNREIESDNENDIFQFEDTRSDGLLYHDKHVFAMGHGTSVNWFDVMTKEKRACKLKTNTLPTYEVPRVIPKSWRGEGSLRMMDLASAESGEQLYLLLSPLLRDYESWINKVEKKSEKLEFSLREIANEHLKKCKESLLRMEKGIKTLTTNKLAFKAFLFANRAMAMQRAHAVWARENKKKQHFSEQISNDSYYEAIWRPFQIGFVLQSLTSIVNPNDDDRNVCDLLWFPTGGGKTEAYLGLTAFTLGYRRLRGDVEGLSGSRGVTVIMRYTLRLLTIQQFQRATALICACEVIRKENITEYGIEPFSIGLWVGGGSTPNRSSDAKEAINILIEAFRNRNVGDVFFPKGSPFQIIVCPWCGSSLMDSAKTVRLTYTTNPKTSELKVCCSNKHCQFSIKNPNGLPVSLIDDTIYENLPSLLIATVDKFARTPWVEATRKLFGKDSNTLPPELIIQDELHLISGPLGTIVGLYEAAIDELCTYSLNGKVIKPKVIASTATIRRAKEQVQNLFNRDLAIFPSPGIHASDSYFAVEQSLQEKPGRMYLGVFAPGKSMKTALLRIYAALLASTGPMNFKEEEKDPYKTVVGYFNSLRELGGAVRLVEDDVRARMTILEKRIKGQNYQFNARKYKYDIPELTSRISSNKIPEILEELEKNVNEQSGEGIHTVLASNMISVGMDVPRLGLMAVNAQPKTTAEYIQATSRVGREFPGLVLTLYNWVRPRDVSHYENFEGYHSSLYRYVEAISVTPFASRARDKALSAAFIALCRLSINGLSKNTDAEKVKDYIEEIQSLKMKVVDRVKNITNSDIAMELAKEVEDDLDRIIRTWIQEAEKGRLTYERKGETPYLLNSLENRSNKKMEGAFSIPNSMRDVEPQLGIYLFEGNE
jgi:hypothetical protein